MTTSILTNAGAMNANLGYARASNDKGAASERLASGSKLQGNAASTAMYNKAGAYKIVVQQTSANASQGAALADLASASVDQLRNMVTRGLELCAQVNNDALGDSDKAQGNAEYQSMFAQSGSFMRAVKNVEFNGKKLFLGAGIDLETVKEAVRNILPEDVWKTVDSVKKEDLDGGLFGRDQKAKAVILEKLGEDVPENVKAAIKACEDDATLDVVKTAVRNLLPEDKWTAISKVTAVADGKTPQQTIFAAAANPPENIKEAITSAAGSQKTLELRFQISSNPAEAETLVLRLDPINLGTLCAASGFDKAAPGPLKTTENARTEESKMQSALSFLNNLTSKLAAAKTQFESAVKSADQSVLGVTKVMSVVGDANPLNALQDSSQAKNRADVYMNAFFASLRESQEFVQNVAQAAAAA